MGKNRLKPQDHDVGDVAFGVLYPQDLSEGLMGSYEEFESEEAFVEYVREEAKLADEVPPENLAEAVAYIRDGGGFVSELQVRRCLKHGNYFANPKVFTCPGCEADKIEAEFEAYCERIGA